VQGSDVQREEKEAEMAVSLAQSRVTLRIDFPEKIEKGQAVKVFHLIDEYIRTSLKSGRRTESSTDSVTIAGVLLEEVDMLAIAIRMLDKVI
jgi:hypothetical protein